MADAEERAKRRKIDVNADEKHQDFCLATDCIRLRLVSSREEFESRDGCDIAEECSDKNFYCPDEFVKDHIWKEGKIYGYEGLMVNVWLHAASFHTYAKVRWNACNRGHKDYEDVLPGLEALFGEEFVASRDTFVTNLPSYGPQFSDMLRDHGEALTRWSPNGGSDVSEIFRLELQDASPWIRRMMPLILMFVEGASPIDMEDPQWEVYLAVETAGEVRRVTGFCTVYRFFHYPDSQRLRIAQILVLPPYQKKKYGYHLLKSINEVAKSRNAYDVTMEEPSDELQELRLCMDVVRLVKSGLVDSAELAKSASSKVLVPPASLASSIRSHLKISSMQFKHCWEVLVLLHVDDEEKFTQLMIHKMCTDLFETDKNDKGSSKRIIDADNGSRSFVMMPCKGGGGDDGGEQQQQQQEPQVENREAIQQFLEARMEQLIRVAHRVARICIADSIPVSFNIQGWL